MMNIIENNPKFVSHLHIPLQAGSDNVLKSMNRRYNREEFIEIYDQICEKRGFIMRRGEIDYHRAGKTFVDDFRSGKLGKITLD